MSEIIRITGRGAYPGMAEGPAVLGNNSVPGWGNVFDLATGEVREAGNPLDGLSIKSNVLILNGSRGSTAFATQFHRVRVAGVAPVALVIPRIDSRTAATCVVLRIPAVTDLEDDIFSLVKLGDWVRVNGTEGVIEIMPRHPAP